MYKFINREQLYNQIWSIPMTKIAPKYNISTYELKKICDRFKIPTPKAGYWSKLSFGKAVENIALPSFNKSIPCNIKLKSKKINNAFYLHIIKNIHTRTEPVNIVELIPEKKSYGLKIKKNLTNLHPLVEKSAKSLQKAKPDEYGRLHPGSDGLAIYVSRANVHRALLIMDSLCIWFEHQGHKILKRFPDSSRTFLQIDGIDIEIEIIEKSNLTGKIKTHWGYEQNQYTPSGNITLHINEYFFGEQLRTSWSDGKRQRLEDMLDNFIDGVYKAVSSEKARNVKREKERLERDEKRIEAIYEQQCHEYENNMVNKLFKDADNLLLSSKIRSYIDSVQQKASVIYANEPYPEDLLLWLDWAMLQVDRIDPLKDKLPSYIPAKQMIDKMKIL